MCKKNAWFIVVSSCLEKYRKNVYNSLTKITLCLCCCTVAEWTRKWYCCRYGLVSNVVTAFECYIRNVPFVCVSCELGDSDA